MTARGTTSAEMGAGYPAVSLPTSRTAVQLGMGDNHSCAVLDNQTVGCWGYGTSGRLLTGNNNDRGDGAGEMGDAMALANLGVGRTARQISTGKNHNCALLDNHTIKCFGFNGASGRLGYGDTDNRGGAGTSYGDSLPAVNLGTGRTANFVAAGGYHSCAILDDDTLKCWGSNVHGQLGQGDVADRGDGANEMGDCLPTINLGTSRTPKSVSLGDNHTCAVLDTDELKCFGIGTYGRLGTADTTTRGNTAGQMGNCLPVVNLGVGRTVRQIAAGNNYNCALLDNSKIKCFGGGGSGATGWGSTGSLGDASNEVGDSMPYVNMGTGRTAKRVQTGDQVSCAVLDNDTVKCWGFNSRGQLGNGDLGAGADNIGSNKARGDEANEMGDNLPAISIE